jgi:hypothetical protein
MTQGKSEQIQEGQTLLYAVFVEQLDSDLAHSLTMGAKDSESELFLLCPKTTLNYIE